MRNREILTRQFRIVLELSRHPEGIGSERLALRVGASRATINRDLVLLRQRVGLPIQRVRRTGEVWHRLRQVPFASLAATPLQVAALRLAREALSPLRGTALVGQLDALLALLPDHAAPVRGLDIVGKPQRSTARIVRAIDVAMQEGRRLEIVARTAAHGGEARRYLLDPLLLRMVGDELYLFAWSHERKDTRTFKVARIREATVTDARADAHDGLVPKEAFRGAVKAWSGALVEVRVRVRPEVAWLVDEYPLVAGQVVAPERDGGAVVTACVAGLVEAIRWVLSWGRNAVVLEPPALRQALGEELARALEGYAHDQIRSTKVSGVERDGSSKPSRGSAHSRARRRSAPAKGDDA